MKKENINIDSEDKKKNIYSFVKTYLLKNSKLFTILGIILFISFILFFVVMSNGASDEMNAGENTLLLDNIINRLLMLLLVLFSGWVPYLYVPVITLVVYIFLLAGDTYFINNSGSVISVISNTPLILLDILTVSIITSLGVYMCKYATKKYKYSQRTTFSFIDVKIQLCKLTKKSEECEKLLIKKQERLDKIKENNVKIDYLSIFKISPVIIAVNIIACIIEHLTNN